MLNKCYFIIFWIFLSLQSIGQNKLKLSTMRIGYSPITNGGLIDGVPEPSLFVANILFDKRIAQNLTFRPGVSVSRLHFEGASLGSKEIGLWLDLFLDHKINGKRSSWFYYGLSVGYIKLNPLYHTPNMCFECYMESQGVHLNIETGVVVNLFKNTNAYLELGFFKKGLLTIGVSQDLFDRTHKSGH